ncbi:MAG: alpha/beta hydrolase, partial [Cycloclasticus sp.]|nr:alpha/beta hydrolase [Cycloclasticus sp.]
MASIRSQLLAVFLRMTVKKKFAKSGDLTKERESMNKMSAMSVKCERGKLAALGGVPGEWHDAELGSKETVVLYLHGGGY